MKKLLLLLVAVIATCFAGFAAGEPITLSWSFKTNQTANLTSSPVRFNATTTPSGTNGNWSLTFTGTISAQKDGTNGPRFGSKSAPLPAGSALTLSNSDIPANAVITGVTFTTKGNAGSSQSTWKLSVNGAEAPETKTFKTGTTENSIEWTGLNLAGNEIVLTATSIDAGIHFAGVSVTYTENTVDPSKTEATLTWSKTSDEITVGDIFVAPTLAKSADDVVVTYTSDNEALLAVDATTGEMTLTPEAVGTANITASVSAEDPNYYGESAVYTLTVKKPVVPGEYIDDILTAQSFNLIGNGYSEKTYENTELGISYSGMVAGVYPSGAPQNVNANYFAIRNSNSSGNFGGIVVTKSNMVATTVTITQWADQSTERKAFVYGSATPYTAGKGIYTSHIPEGSVQIGEATMTPGTPVSIELSQKYPYICIISNGSLQMEQITITWGTTAAPTVTINGEAVTDFDNNYNLNKQTASVVLTAPEGHHVHHKFVKDSADNTPAPSQLRGITPAEGFTDGNAQTVTLSISENGQLHFYAIHPETGAKSETKVLMFVGGTTSIAEVGVEAAEAEWFDVQGRRVAAPAKGGVYILKQGTKVSKRVL